MDLICLCLTTVCWADQRWIWYHQIFTCYASSHKLHWAHHSASKVAHLTLYNTYILSPRWIRPDLFEPSWQHPKNGDHFLHLNHSQTKSQLASMLRNHVDGADATLTLRRLHEIGVNGTLAFRLIWYPCVIVDAERYSLAVQSGCSLVLLGHESLPCFDRIHPQWEKYIGICNEG